MSKNNSILKEIVEYFIMRWTNYHGHCNYCDGHGSIEEYINAAINLGMPMIGISSHAPVPFDCFWTMKAEALKDYFSEIDVLKEKYRGKIQILKSLEIDYVPNITGPSLFFDKYNLDYAIGSIHFVDWISDGNGWGIDGSFDEFNEGLQKIFDGDVKAAVKRFYELSREMIDNGKFSIIGHLDKIKMHNVTKVLFEEKEKWYQEELVKTFDLLSKNNIIVEINTKSYKRNGLIFPGVEYFSMMQRKGISVTINSDAHYPSDLITGFSFVASELLKAGYQTLKVFDDHKWIDVTFNQNGINL